MGKNSNSGQRSAADNATDGSQVDDSQATATNAEGEGNQTTEQQSDAAAQLAEVLARIDGIERDIQEARDDAAAERANAAAANAALKAANEEIAKLKSLNRDKVLDDHFLSIGTQSPKVKPVEGLAVYAVDIPGCLVGPRFVQADNDAEALEAYKRPCGIQSHETPATVQRTDLDPFNLPEGVELFG